jgi:hypothetical protein
MLGEFIWVMRYHDGEKEKIKYSESFKKGWKLVVTIENVLCKIITYRPMIEQYFPELLN